MRSFAMFLLWSVLGALIVAAFFISAFFGDFGPIRFSAPGLTILFMPIFTAFVLGLLLVDYELVTTVISAIFTTVLAIAFVVGFMFAPLIAGVAGEGELLQQFSVQRAALSAVLLFPLVLLGTVVGRAMGERILPPDTTREKRKALMEETRAWHDQLNRREPPASPPPPPEGPRP